MKLALIALATLALPSLAHARTVTISTESMSYPSPATTHLAIVQDEIARKAIAACGGEAKVEGIRNLQIAISPGLDNADVVGAITHGKFQLALELNYPELKSTATVVCRD